jgi:hypothetical protein
VNTLDAITKLRDWQWSEFKSQKLTVESWRILKSAGRDFAELGGHRSPVTLEAPLGLSFCGVPLSGVTKEPRS